MPPDLAVFLTSDPLQHYAWVWHCTFSHSLDGTNACTKSKIYADWGRRDARRTRTMLRGNTLRLYPRYQCEGNNSMLAILDFCFCFTSNGSAYWFWKNYDTVLVPYPTTMTKKNKGIPFSSLFDVGNGILKAICLAQTPLGVELCVEQYSCLLAPVLDLIICTRWPCAWLAFPMSLWWSTWQSCTWTQALCK